jgi:hypothetical protein
VTPDPEAPLWLVFDRLGLPFREARQDLIARYGTRPSLWATQMQECPLPAAPLLPGLSDFHFQFGTHPGAVDDLTTAPDWLTASYRVHSRLSLADRVVDRRVDRNHADVVRALAAMFGPGTDRSAINAWERRWQFGRALLTAHTFPPRLNTRFGPNSRHAADPGSATETSVTFNPGWLPDLTDVQRGWLASFRPIGTPDPWAPAQGFPPPLWHRWPADLGPLPEPSYGPSADGAGFVVVTNAGFVKALPRDWLVNLCRDVVTPARGPGGTTLAVSILRSGQPHLPPDTITLSVGPPDTLADEADRIAKALILPLVTRTFPDD